MGLYSVLWGKYKEYKEKEEETIQDIVKGTCSNHHHSVNNCQMETVREEVGEANNNDDIEMQKKNSTSSTTTQWTHELAKNDTVPRQDP